MGLFERRTTEKSEAEKRVQRAIALSTTQLDLPNFSLKTVPQELSQLSNLKWLDLSFNQLTSLPKELGHLSHLWKLYLHFNQLTSLPKELGHLSGLSVLNLRSNRLTSLPKELGHLSGLYVLDLSSNQLTSLPKELGHLSSLSVLDLSSNQLTSLPKGLKRLSNLRELFLHNNDRLGIPAEILGPTRVEVHRARGGKATPARPKDILDYYFRIRTATHPLNEAKLILIGFGAVGKTSLANRLINNEFDPKSQKTEGIQITQWPIQINSPTKPDLEDITLHVWDFGGQEILHSTHQFFLTERSIYILVLNGRQGHEDSDAEYWLELIKSFGGGSPVIVVLNKIHEQPFDVNRRALQQKFPNIQEFIETDCGDDPIGIEKVRTAIYRETDRLDGLRAKFPSSWANIKDYLSNMEEDYISFDEYQDICAKDGETEPSAQERLAEILHVLGIALNYKEDLRLRDTHVLNPHWVTNGIYTLLNNHDLSKQKGELDISCLSTILSSESYPRDRHGFLMDLMRKFELCFRFPEDDRRYLIPDLLDKQQPEEAETFDPSTCLNFRYEYPILPEGLLPRFIVRTHVLSQQALRWRTGVILDFEGNRALVKADPQDRSVSINIDGPSTSRRRLLAIIRSDFDRIHSNFKFEPKQLVPIPQQPQASMGYKELLVLEQKGIKTLPKVIDEDVIELDIQALLNGVDLDGGRQRGTDRTGLDRHNTALSLFYSYSHKDETLRDELETHLKLLQRQGLIRTWHDRCIPAGEEWERAISDQLNQADIILLLISADFIASNYCYDVEMQRAMERYKNGEALVIPILLRPVGLEGSPFAKLQGLPSGLQAVTQWKDRDLAWRDVEDALKRIIQQSYRK